MDDDDASIRNWRITNKEHREMQARFNETATPLQKLRQECKDLMDKIKARRNGDPSKFNEEEELADKAKYKELNDKYSEELQRRMSALSDEDLRRLDPLITDPPHPLIADDRRELRMQMVLLQEDKGVLDNVEYHLDSLPVEGLSVSAMEVIDRVPITEGLDPALEFRQFNLWWMWLKDEKDWGTLHVQWRERDIVALRARIYQKEWGAFIYRMHPDFYDPDAEESGEVVEKDAEDAEETS